MSIESTETAQCSVGEAAAGATREGAAEIMAGVAAGEEATEIIAGVAAMEEMAEEIMAGVVAEEEAEEGADTTTVEATEVRELTSWISQDMGHENRRSDDW